MARYFDPEADDHVTLLPAQYRRVDGLVDEAAAAEREVIALYTQLLPPSIQVPRVLDQSGSRVIVRGPSGPRTLVADGRAAVGLAGYTEDADAAPAGLRLALRQTIAKVLAWRLQARNRTNMAASEYTSGSKGVTWMPGAHATLPPGWNSLLAPYDTREAAWAM